MFLWTIILLKYLVRHNAEKMTLTVLIKYLTKAKLVRDETKGETEAI